MIINLKLSVGFSTKTNTYKTTTTTTTTKPDVNDSFIAML